MENWRKDDLVRSGKKPFFKQGNILWGPRQNPGNSLDRKSIPLYEGNHATAWRWEVSRWTFGRWNIPKVFQKCLWMILKCTTNQCK